MALGSLNDALDELVQLGNGDSKYHWKLTSAESMKGRPGIHHSQELFEIANRYGLRKIWTDHLAYPSGRKNIPYGTTFFLQKNLFTPPEKAVVNGIAQEIGRVSKDVFRESDDLATSYDFVFGETLISLFRRANPPAYHRSHVLNETGSTVPYTLSFTVAYENPSEAKAIFPLLVVVSDFSLQEPKVREGIRLLDQRLLK